MKNAIQATQKHFESSCFRTPEYRAWHRLFKREFTKFLAEHNIEDPAFSKPNHFDLSGFFCKLKKGVAGIWYFRIEDIRWSKENMLIRTAQSFQDYGGGNNQYISLLSDESFKRGFEGIIA